MFRILYKITIILVLVAVFPMALAIRNADHLVTQNIQSSLNTNVIRLASSLNRVISEYQTRYLLEAELVAGSAELVQAVEREGFYFRINDILPRYRRLLSADSLYLYHPDGLLLGNSGWGVAAGGGVLSSARTDGFFTNLVVQDGKIVFFNSAVVRNGSGVLISQYILNRRMAKEIGELIGAEVAFTIPGAGTITSLDDTGGFDRATVWVTSNRTALLTNLQLGSGPFRSCFMPLLNSSGKLVGVASVHLPTSSLSVIRAGNRINLMVVGFIATLVAVMVGFIFSFGITNPIGRLLRWTQVLASGDLEHRVSIQSRDEIGRLAESFDEMRLRILEVNRSLESKVEERTLQLAEERNQLVIRNEIMER